MLQREELLSEMLRRARKRLRRRTSHAQRQMERKSSRCSRNSSCRRNHLERRGARESKSAKFDTETGGDFGQSPWGPRKPAEFLDIFGRAFHWRSRCGFCSKHIRYLVSAEAARVFEKTPSACVREKARFGLESPLREVRCSREGLGSGSGDGSGVGAR